MCIEEKLLRMRIEERERLGRELHDTICQELAGANLLLCALEGDLRTTSEADADKAARIADCVRKAMSYLRRIAMGLEAVDIRPAGLIEALSELCAETGRIYGVDCRFRFEGNPPRLAQEAATHLYCLAREGVSNAIRHGEASRISVSLRAAGDRCVLGVSDNGKGPATPSARPGGNGLAIMRYRARRLGGSLRLSRNKGGGALLVCAFSISRSSTRRKT